MSKALYRKYRSKSLDEIVGQEHITAILKRAIEHDKIAHAYLLTGPRGVGKTSIARILAHEINALPYDESAAYVDIIEIDAASNNSVEDIRDLREKVQIAPVSAKKKVYIIDEVHMLSKSAFNALLKTLEEPPEHVVFILATTDADKLPATIISRVQRFNFRTISIADATKHLRTIADTESIAIDDDALELVAQRGRGSFRDSIGLLDQLQNLSDGTITRNDIEALLGIASETRISEIITHYERGDLASIVADVAALEAEAISPITIAEQLIRTVSKELVNKPHFAPLLNTLTEVARSSWPYIKLLVALTPHTVAPSVAAPVMPKPQPTRPQKPAKAPDAPSKHADTAKPPIAPATVSTPPASSEPKKPAASINDFSWPAILNKLKTDGEAGLHTLLGKSGFDVTSTALTIYSGRAFSKKQIDKALPTLGGVLNSFGYGDLEVSVLPTAKPPEDDDAASIIAMMGGGEEVAVNG